MLLRNLLSLGIFLLTCTLALSSASAEEGESGLPAKPKERRAFVGLSAGAAYATVKHPLVISNGFSATTLGMHAGYNITERWALGVELTSVEQSMSRDSPNDPFAPIGYVKPQAGCTNCEAPPVGGWVMKSTATFGTVGPRVEFAPFGRDGLYLGLSTGLGVILGVDTNFGLGGGARAGYRVRIADILGLAVEGGIQAQYFGAVGSGTFPYASIMMRPYF